MFSGVPADHRIMMLGFDILPPDILPPENKYRFQRCKLLLLSKEVEIDFHNTC